MSLTTLSLPAPAKLNLLLHITGRRSDGYHKLQTLFQFIDLADQMVFKVDLSSTNHQIHLKSTINAEVDPEDNLIVRAARLLQKHTGCNYSAYIELNKKLPMGGGIGGGSSDAATTLVALNRLWQLQLSEPELLSLGLQLGADVPVFIKGASAFAEGIGEELHSVELPEPWYLLVAPACHVSTVKLYGHPELTRNSPLITIAHALQEGGHNDFEPLVRRLYPEVDEAFNHLAPFGLTRLSGSGGCVFTSFSSREQAEAAQHQLPEGWRSYVCRGCNRSPLFQALAKEVG